MPLPSLHALLRYELSSAQPFMIIEELLHRVPRYDCEFDREDIRSWIAAVRRVRAACRWEAPVVRRKLAFHIASICFEHFTAVDFTGDAILDALLDNGVVTIPHGGPIVTINHVQISLVPEHLDSLANATDADIHGAILAARAWSISTRAGQHDATWATIEICLMNYDPT